MANTYFALHGQTGRDIDDNALDDELAEYTGYDIKKTPSGEEPSRQNIVTGEIDAPLIYKGRHQAMFVASQIIANDKDKKLDTIFCADQKRCIQTAKIVAEILNANGFKVIVSKREELNARGCGALEYENMSIGDLKGFYKVRTGSVKRDLELVKAALGSIVMPKRLDIESKSEFNKRVEGFFIDQGGWLKNALIIAGPDVYELLKKNKSQLRYRDIQLHRGELAKLENIPEFNREFSDDDPLRRYDKNTEAVR